VSPTSEGEISHQPAISIQAPDETLFVTANLAQPCAVEVSVGMRRVKLYASLIGRLRTVITFQLFENDRAVNRAVLAFLTSATSHDVQGAVLQLILFDTETNSPAETWIQRDVTAAAAYAA
jgi:hypothetical protein